ncbi:response regulator transcription factor [Chitinimonas koreensis]|nr:response regulator transcription factor [Chitinimonas koreensis]
MSQADTPASKRTSVVIADDHSLVRVGIQTLLGRLDRFEVIGEAIDGNEALALILQLKPDIVLMDIAMPGLSGIEVAERLRDAGSVSRVIMLSGNEDPAVVMTALKAGSHGYLAKDLLLAELEIALDAVLHGNSYLSPRVAHHVIASAARPEMLAAEPAPAPAAPVEESPLTERQRDVLAGVARGLSTKEIARELNISPKTVEFHRAQISERLGVRDIAGLVRRAAKMGLVKLD